MTKRKLSPNRPVRRQRRIRITDLVAPIDAMTAFEELRSDLSDVEALARTAEENLEALPYIKDPEKRRAIGRLYTLVQKTGETATEALDRSDVTQRRLDGHMRTHKSRRLPPGPSQRGPR